MKSLAAAALVVLLAASLSARSVSFVSVNKNDGAAGLSSFSHSVEHGPGGSRASVDSFRTVLSNDLRQRQPKPAAFLTPPRGGPSAQLRRRPGLVPPVRHVDAGPAPGRTVGGPGPFLRDPLPPPTDYSAPLGAPGPRLGAPRPPLDGFSPDGGGLGSAEIRPPLRAPPAGGEIFREDMSRAPPRPPSKPDVVVPVAPVKDSIPRPPLRTIDGTPVYVPNPFKVPPVYEDAHYPH